MEMDNTVDAELALECDVCGMRDFYQEGGYFYCNLCNTQSQQSRLFVEDDEPDGGGASQQLRSRLAVLEDEEAIAASIVGGRKKLSSWEVFNLVLRSLTEKLICLGFPPLLRDEVLGLYARYLTKRKAIFVSEKSDKPSAITHLEPKTNIYAFYDRKRKPNEYVTTEKLEKKKKKAEKGAVEEDVFSSAGRRRKRTAARRKAFEQEYLDYQSDHDRPPKSPYGKKVEEERDIALRCKEGKTVVFTDAYSQVRRELSQQTNINRVKPYEHPSGLSNDMKKCLEVESFTMKSVLILLYIALRKIGCRVLLSDVLRMYHEGTLRIDSIASILPAEEVNQLDLSCNKFLRSGVVGTLFKLRYFPRSFEGLLNYLEISHFPHPALKDFIPKFMDDLKLPQEYECFLSQLISLIPVEELVEELSTRYHRTFFHLFPEFLIYALITVQLKMLFGLDGVTEKFQSHFARRVNRVIKKATQSIDDTHKSKLEKSQLFVVEDWLAHLRYRRSVIHKELYFGSAAPNLKTVNQVVSKISHVPRASTSTVQACESIKSIFQDAVVDLTHGQGIPTLPTYLTPNLPNQDIIQTYVNCYPNIAHLSDCRKLSADFSKCSIDFVYHPNNYVKILKKAGYHVKLVDGDARNSSEDLQDLKDFQLKSKSLRLYQPYKLYDELVGPEEEQSDSIKFLLSLYCNTFPGCNQEEVKDKFRSLIHAVGDILNRKAAKDAIPLVIP